ncbi:MAG: MMPL family transporter [Pseudomonadales bacterium]|nr:MMPL family transporter [Pseudomonadales bacterium]
MSLVLQRWVLDKPWQTIGLCFLFVALASAGLKNFQENGDPRQFFGEEDPVFKLFTSIENQYAGNEMVSFIIHPKNDQIFTRQILHLIETLTDEAWTMPHSTRVDSIANFQNTRVQGDQLDVEYMIEDALNFTDEQVRYVENVVMSEPALKNALISNRGHVSAVFVRIVMDDQNVDGSEVVTFAKQLRDKYRERYPDVEIMMTGTVPFAQAGIAATRSEIIKTMPLGMLIVIGLLLAMLRSVSLMLVTLVLVILSITAGVGLGCWLGIVISPMAAAAPAMILT